MNRNKYQVKFNKHNRHYGIIIGSKGDRFESVTLTHASRTNNSNNIKLDKNPNKKDKSNSYLVKRLTRIPKYYYGKNRNDFNFIDSDKCKIDKLAKEKHKYKLWH